MWICSNFVMYLVMQMANIMSLASPGVGPRVNQKDCKMGGAVDNSPQEWVNKRKSSGSTASQWKIPLIS